MLKLLCQKIIGGGNMGFIIILAVCVILFFVSIILGIIAWERKKEKKNKIRPIKRKKENILTLISVLGLTLTPFFTLLTLLTAVPSPTIYPLNNEARIYTGTADVYIDTSPWFTTYYSLDGSDPKDGYIYTGKFTITETTTVVARNRFLYIFWSKPEDNTYRFESVQNTAVTYVNEYIDLETLRQILLLSLAAFVVFCAAIKKLRELFTL